MKNEYNSQRVPVFPLMGPHLDSTCEEVVNVCCSKLLEALGGLHEGGIVHRRE